jgi:hypothetical protein
MYARFLFKRKFVEKARQNFKRKLFSVSHFWRSITDLKAHFMAFTKLKNRDKELD